MNTKGSITVVAYSRHVELDACLKAIDIARQSRDIPLIIVHQKGYPEVDKVLNKWADRIDLLVTTTAQGTTALENINLNGLLSREIAFKWMLSDWSVGIEEDTVISPDAINFVIYCFEKYRKNPFFRGVNLGSKNAYSVDREGSYSLVSYGVQGQASMLTQKTWNHFNIKKFRKKIMKAGLDSMMEHYVKSGFMCTPHNSRYLDMGWNGTHASPNPEDEHYRDLRKSLSKVDSTFIGPYLKQRIEVKWREDAHQFSILMSYPRYLICKIHHFRYLILKFASKDK